MSGICWSFLGMRWHCSSAIYSSTNSGRFCNTKKVSPTDAQNYGSTRTSQFAMTMWQHTVNAKIIDTYKHGCDLPPSLLPNFAPCNLFLITKLQLGRHYFHDVPEIQAQSPTPLSIIQKNLAETLDPWKSTTLKGITVINIKGKHALHYHFSPETSGYTPAHPHLAAHVMCRSQ